MQSTESILFIILISLISLLVIAVLILVGIIVQLVLRKNLLKNEPQIIPTHKPDLSIKAQAVRQEEDEASTLDPTIKLAGHCSKHPNEIAQGMCAICATSLCENCIRQYETLQFCPEHFELYTTHKWLPLKSITTTPKEIHKAMVLYTFKEKKWEKEKIPTYLMTHYKIDVHSDHIESQIQLFVREEDYDILLEEISNEASESLEQ